MATASCVKVKRAVRECVGGQSREESCINMELYQLRISLIWNCINFEIHPPFANI